MPQTEFLDFLREAIEGQIADGSYNKHEVTKINPLVDPVAQVEQVQVIGATNDTEYELTVNGVRVTFTSDADATIEEVRDGLEAALLANQFVTEDVSITVQGTDIIFLTSVVAGEPIVVTTGGAGAGDLDITTSVENVTAGDRIEFGLGVVADTTFFDRCRLPNGAGGSFAGIAIHTHKEMRNKITSVNDPEGGQLPAAYEPGQTARIMEEGRIVVVPEDVPTPTDPVYMRHTISAAGQRRGAFRTDDDGGNAQLVDGLRWAHAGESVGDFAIIDVQFID